MDQPTSDNTDTEDEVQSPSKQFFRRLQSRDSEVNKHDLLDPPNNVEAFKRLEAAMDEFKRQAAVDRRPISGEKFLDPPTTAKRFARIEAAMDELLGKPASSHVKSRISTKCMSTRRTPLHHRTSNPGQEANHRLRKRPPQLTRSTMCAKPQDFDASDTTSKNAQSATDQPDSDYSKIPTSNTPKPSRDMYGFSEIATRTAEGAQVSARTVLLPTDTDPNASFIGKELFEQDMDIFRSEDAMAEFMKQTFHSSREKYM
ncbi:hypothetical protein Q7P37_006497 [Cladosporium fusiforme]